MRGTEPSAGVNELVASERAARLAAEEATIRVENLQRLTEAALVHLDLDDLLNELLNRVVEILHADTSAVLLVDEDGETLSARAAKGLEEEVERGFKLPVGKGFAGTVAETRAPLIIDDISRPPVQVVNPLFREKGIHSLAGVPLVVERRLIGVLHVGSREREQFSSADIQLLQLVGDRVALAIDHARLGVQRRIAHVLQRNLLPRDLPRISGVKLAARYQAATSQTAVGGDWYDVFPLFDGTLAVSIGDVVGKGPEAASLMGQIRSALRAYALYQSSPGEVLAKVCNFVRSQPGYQMATAIYATFAPVTGEIRLSRAGHPHPVVVSAEGKASLFETEPAPPLGVSHPAAYPESGLSLERGSTLLLYTDGLIERRGERLDARERELLAAVEDSWPADPDALCDAVMERLGSGDSTADDVAVLALDNAGVDERLVLDVPARADELSDVRRVLRTWLTETDADEDEIAGIILACSEAAANSVEHAYGPGDETVEISASRIEGGVEIVVRDTGSWREPRGHDRGRGIDLMGTFMDEVDVSTTEEGTTVRMTKRLGDAA